LESKIFNKVFCNKKKKRGPAQKNWAAALLISDTIM